MGVLRRVGSRTGAVFRQAAELEPGRARWAAALAPAAVVIGTLTAIYPLAGIAVAVNSGVIALNVGLLDRGQSPRFKWRYMSAGAAAMVAATVLTGLAGDRTSVVVALAAVLAFACGFSRGINPTAPAVFMFAAFVVCVAAIKPVSPSQVPVLAAGAALGAAIQVAVAAAVDWARRDHPERRAVAGAIDAVAAFFRAAAESAGKSDERLHVESRRQATRSLRSIIAAERSVAGSDLPASERGHWMRVLAALDEARLRARGSSGRNDVAWDEEAAQALDAIAKSVASAQPEALDRATARLASAAADGGAVSAQLRELADAIGGDPGGRPRRTRRSPAVSLGARWRMAAQPMGVPMRSGFRLAIAVVVAAVLGASAGVGHPYWIMITCLLLLRPDAGATLPRMVGRVLGITVVVPVVIAATWALGSSPAALVIVAAAATLLLYAIGPTNYAVFVGLVSAVLVSLTALGGGDPNALILERWEDILIGAAISLPLAWLIPTWVSGQLPRDAQEYARAMSRMFAAAAQAIGVRPSERGRAMVAADAAAHDARRRRVDAEARLHAALVEPRLPEETIATCSRMLEQGRASADAVARIRLHLLAECPRSDPAAEACEEASGAWAQAARAMSREEEVLARSQSARAREAAERAVAALCRER